MRFPRTVRLDSSDLHALAPAAEPGEWAVTGSFAFADRDPASLAGKERVAFRSGWLGTTSFGWSTLVELAEITEPEYFAVVERLARHLVECYGAPDLVSALPAARAEADDAAGLCRHKLHSLLAIERQPSGEGIIERVRVIAPARAPDHARIWTIETDPNREPKA